MQSVCNAFQSPVAVVVRARQECGKCLFPGDSILRQEAPHEMVAAAP